MSRIVIPAWFGLGAYRGSQLYYYYYKDDISHNKKTQYYYSECVNWSLAAGVFYLIPFTFPFALRKELYRLEVNIRNLDEEKKSVKYYEIE